MIYVIYEYGKKDTPSRIIRIEGQSSYGGKFNGVRPVKATIVEVGEPGVRTDLIIRGIKHEVFERVKRTLHPIDGVLILSDNVKYIFTDEELERLC